MRPEQESFFEALYKENFPLLWRKAAAVLHNSDLAAEVVQDLFPDTVKKIDEVMEQPEPQLWLRRQLIYKLLHAQRSFYRDRRLFVSLDADVSPQDPVLAGDDVPVQSAGEILRQVRAALKPDEWELFCKIILERRPYKEVAEEHGHTIWACQKRVQRIREKLKRLFS